MPPTDYKNAGHGVHHAAIIAAPFLLTFWGRIKAYWSRLRHRNDPTAIEAHRVHGLK